MNPFPIMGLNGRYEITSNNDSPSLLNLMSVSDGECRFNPCALHSLVCLSVRCLWLPIVPFRFPSDACVCACGCLCEDRGRSDSDGTDASSTEVLLRASDLSAAVGDAGRCSTSGGVAGRRRAALWGRWLCGGTNTFLSFPFFVFFFSLGKTGVCLDASGWVFVCGSFGTLLGYRLLFHDVSGLQCVYSNTTFFLINPFHQYAYRHPS